MNVSRTLRMTFLAIAALVGGSALASTPSLVVEVESGRVLHAERATDPWYPASVTKLMTTYVALDLVRSGHLNMETLLTVSGNAAAQPPSKMGFKPGTQIRLDNALKILLVKSANDVATTIAENIGGSVEGFSEIMNAHARRLGMSDSHFVNPHGLPDERNRTTARDMAILARALLMEFPEHGNLFHIGAIQFGRRIMRNTNGLIGRYPGADGMKTGFVCSSGFNVVATAKRNGRHLIAVVFGSPSANERTMKTADLFDRGFNTRVNFTNPTLTALPSSAVHSPPDMRPIICDRRGPMPKEEDSPTTVASEEDTNTPNLLSSSVMAFAGGTAPVRTTLGPRAAVQPERVWVGLTPPTEAELAAEAAREKAAAEKVRNAKSKKKAAPAKDAAKKDSDSQDKADAKGKSNTRSSVSLKPVSDSKDKPKASAKPAAKPQASAGAKAEAASKTKSKN